MLTNFKKREKHGSAMTTLQCNHKRGKEIFGYTVIAMQPELHTSHQKASSNPCSRGILDPQSLKLLQQMLSAQKIMAAASGKVKA
jgi:hypothetical protein